MIIDSFVVELGLDPTKFTEGQRKAYEAAKKMESGVLSSAKNIEHGAERAGEAISGIRTQALQLFAVFAGGKGVLQFTNDLIHSNAQLGRLERNIGISASTISKWQGAARIMGGDAATMAQTFTTLSDAFAGWQIGKVTPLIADLRAISTAGGKVIDVNKGVEQSMLDLAENLKRIHDSGPDGPARAGLLGRMVGIDPATFDAMITGQLGQVLDYVKKIGVATRQDTDAFGELEKRINQMGLKAESLGRKLLAGNGESRSPAAAIIALADELNKPAAEARPWDAIFGWGEYANKTATPKLFESRGAFTSQGEKEQFIRAEAARRGINPNTAMAVARSEGFDNFQSTVITRDGSREKSFGSFQLYMGGGLGNEFQKRTGLDPSDPRNERATIQFALDDAARNGWKAYHGAAKSGIDNWSGIDRNFAQSSSTSKTEVNIGTVNVTPPAGADAETFASRFSAAVARQSYGQQAAAGQQ